MKKKTKDKNLNSDFDSGWKEIIEIYFQQFVEFFYPELHKLIDYKKGYEFLDKQLLQIISNSKIGNREVDNLVKVYLKNGKQIRMIFHIEVQVQQDTIEIVEKRMFIYYYKLFEKYEHQIVSLLILGDTNKNYRPEKYESNVLENQLLFKYRLVKLIDFDIKELEESKNVFAMITLSHLKALEAGSNNEKKKIFKLELVRKLRKKGYTHKDIRNLHKFIDWLIQLPTNDEKEILIKVKEMEEVMNMPILLRAEKIAKDEGKKEERKISEVKIKRAENKFKRAENKIRKVERKVDKLITILVKAGYDKLKIQKETGFSDSELDKYFQET